MRIFTSNLRNFAEHCLVIADANGDEFDAQNVVMIDTGTTYTMVSDFAKITLTNVENGHCPVRVGSNRVMHYLQRGIALSSVHDQIGGLPCIVFTPCLLAPEVPIPSVSTESWIKWRGSVISRDVDLDIEMQQGDTATVHIPHEKYYSHFFVKHMSHFFLRPVQHNTVLQNGDHAECCAAMQCVLQDEESVRWDQIAQCFSCTCILG